jgi:multidrug efflux pump subunit AcrA (membrane-fusion protein)
VYELRAARGGRVVRVEVDEGQMVAEEDEIVLLQSDAGPVMVTTDVPGVVRELYVEAGLTVGPGAVVALIDEA